MSKVNFLLILSISFISLDTRIFVGKEESPNLLAALIWGPIIYPKSSAFGSDFKLELSSIVAIALDLRDLIISKPLKTNVLLIFFKGTTSQTVPSATKSKKYNKLGSLLNLKKFCFLKVLRKAIKKRKVTPTAAKF